MAPEGAPRLRIETPIQRPQESPGATIVHLVSYSGEMERPIKRTVVLEGAVVRLRDPREPARVHARRAGHDLAWHREGEYLTFCLPCLSHHDMIHLAWARERGYST